MYHLAHDKHVICMKPKLAFGLPKNTALANFFQLPSSELNQTGEVEQTLHMLSKICMIMAASMAVGCDHVSWIGPNLLHLLPRISFGIPLEAGPISRGEGKQVARVCATLSHRYLVVDG